MYIYDIYIYIACQVSWSFITQKSKFTSLSRFASLFTPLRFAFRSPDADVSADMYIQPGDVPPRH